MNGHTAAQPIAEVVREIITRQLSGALRIHYDQVKHTIYFKSGVVVLAISNLRSYRLDSFLRQLNILSEQQLQAISQKSQSEADFSAHLIKDNLIDQEGLAQVFEQRTREIAASALLAQKGEWKLELSVKPTQHSHFGIKVSQLLIETGRQLPLTLIKSSFSNPEECLVLGKNASSLDASLLSSEAMLLSRADAPSTLAELIMLTGLSESEVFRSAYALLLGGLLEREQWPTVLEAKQANADEDERQKQAEAAATVVPDSASKISQSSGKDDEADEQVRMHELFSRADGENHFEVLGVDRDAEAQHVKLAYYNLARKYHPDRFRQHQDSGVRARIERSFSRIREAYDALKRQTARNNQASGEHPFTDTTTVETKTGAPPPTAAAPPSWSPPPPVVVSSTDQVAEESFQQGLKELEHGNEVLAVARLSEAVQLSPKVARYHAQYGLALAGNAQTRRLAEAEFQTALKLDGRNVDYHVMLAEVYRELGMKRRAEGQLQQALSIDPNRRDARQLLNALRAA